MARSSQPAPLDEHLAELLERRRAAAKNPVHFRAWSEKVLEELVLLWEEAQDAHGPDEIELCRECPDLLPELQRRISQLRRVDTLFGRTSQSTPQILTGEVPTKEDHRQIGPYEVLRKLGEGAMGKVYQARHESSGEIVAVKLLQSQSRTSVKRFEQELTASRKIDHPNVVRVLAFDKWQGAPYLVMEYVDGQSLDLLIKRAQLLPEMEAIRLIGQVCEGLGQAHQRGVIHRDVKPDNILVTREGVAKLADLGLVKDRDAMLNLTGTGRGLGTPHYMAPEQHDAAKTADAASDIFALGATLYTMLTGQPPYGRDTSIGDIFLKKLTNDFPSPRQLAPQLSSRTDNAVRRCLRANPAERPKSCRVLMEALVG